MMCIAAGILVRKVTTHHQLTVLRRSLERHVFLVLCSTTDDPAVIAAMLPWSAFAAHRHLRSVRWSLCAREICFKNALLRSVDASAAHAAQLHAAAAE